MVQANQLVNPAQMKITETFVKQKSGVTMMHEVMEAYIAAWCYPGAKATDMEAFNYSHDYANRIDGRRDKKKYGADTKIYNVDRNKGTFDFDMYLIYGGQRQLLYKVQGKKIPKGK